MKLEQFLSRIEPQDSGCWIWVGAHTPEGYGKLRWNGGFQYAHRLSYELFVGPLCPGAEADHSCVNPPCISPEHVQMTMPKENIRLREKRRGRLIEEGGTCRNGHELSADNIMPSGRRKRCRTCSYAAYNRRYAAKKAVRTEA